MRIDFLSVPRNRGTVLLKTGENEKKIISQVFVGRFWCFRGLIGGSSGPEND